MSLDQAGANHKPLLRPPLRLGAVPPISAWLPFLQIHPDNTFAKYIARGLTNGFHIGFNPTIVTLRQFNRNHQSVQDNPQIFVKVILYKNNYYILCLFTYR